VPPEPGLLRKHNIPWAGLRIFEVDNARGEVNPLPLKAEHFFPTHPREKQQSKRRDNVRAETVADGVKIFPESAKLDHAQRTFAFSLLISFDSTRWVGVGRPEAQLLGQPSL
jgi:hypothetical protein